MVTKILGNAQVLLIFSNLTISVSCEIELNVDGFALQMFFDGFFFEVCLGLCICMCVVFAISKFKCICVANT